MTYSTRFPVSPANGRVGQTIVASAMPLALVVELIALGANSLLLEPLAAIAHFAVALLILAALPARTKAVRAAAPTFAALILALLWGAVPEGMRVFGGGPVALAPGNFAPSWIAQASLLACILAGALVAAHGPRQAERGVDALLFLGLLWMLGGLVLYKVDPFALRGVYSGGQQGRFSGTLLNPNANACVCAMLAILAAARFLHAVERFLDDPDVAAWRSLANIGLALIAAAVAVAALVLGRSRLAVTLLALALALLLLHRRSLIADHPGWFAFCAAALLVPAVGGAAIAGGSVSDKFALIGGDFTTRLADMAHYYRLTLDRPWFGYGLGAFREIHLATLTPQDVMQRWSYGAAHNFLLQAALEGGWPYAALLLAAILAAAVRGVRGGGLSTHDPLGFATMLAIAVALVCGTFDIALNVPAVAALTAWLAGLALGRAAWLNAATASPRRAGPASAARWEHKPAFPPAPAAPLPDPHR